jgi:hypothetical protein
MNSSTKENYNKRNFTNQNSQTPRDPNRPKKPPQQNPKLPDSDSDWKHDKFGTPKPPHAPQKPQTNSQRFQKNPRNQEPYHDNQSWAHDKFQDLEREFNTKKNNNFKKKKLNDDQNLEKTPKTPKTHQNSQNLQQNIQNLQQNDPFFASNLPEKNFCLSNSEK